MRYNYSKMKLAKGFLFGLIILAMLVFPIFVSHAQDSGESGGGNKIQNPLSGNDSLIDFFNTILDKIIIPIGAILAVVFVVYSGYLFVTAGGDETKINTAKKNILYVLIGAAIILGAKAIASGVQGTVNSLQQGGDQQQQPGGDPPPL